jgi:hypothetical protein
MPAEFKDFSTGNEKYTLCAPFRKTQKPGLEITENHQ